MPPSSPWVVVDAAEQPAIARCLCCGEKQTLPFPMRISIMAAISNAMCRDHANCPTLFERLAFATR